MNANATQGAERAAVFVPISKVDESKRLVFGRAIQEVPDRVGEVFDYDTSKPFFEAWSTSQSEASMGKSMGNVRAMHKDVAAGILVPKDGLLFHDDERAIDVCAHVTDDSEWEKVLTGTYTGFSIGGSYVKKWEDLDLKKVRYTADPAEISLVDRPCVPTSTFFEVVKADGAVEKREFKAPVDAGDTGTTPGAASESGYERKDAIAYLVAKGEKIEALAAESDATLRKRYEDGQAADKAEAEAGPVIDVTVGSPEELVAFSAFLSARKMTIGDVTKALIQALDPDAPDPKTVARRARDLAKAAGEEGADAWKTHIEDASLALRDEVAGITDESVTARALELAKAAGHADTSAMTQEQTSEFSKAARAELRKVAAREDTSPKEGKAKYGNVKFADEKNKKYPIDTEAHIRAAWNYINKAKNASKYSAEDAKAIKSKIVSAWKAKIDKDGPPAASEKAMTTSELRKGLYNCGRLGELIQSLDYLAESVEYEAMVEDDGSDIGTRLNAACADLCQILVDMTQEEVDEMNEGKETPDTVAPVMAMAEQARGLVKRLKKAEATHVAASLKHVQKMHDLAKAMGATCNAAGGEGSDAGAGKLDAGELAKRDEENAALKKTVADLTATAEALRKDVEMLKAQPAPSKARLRVITKGQDLDDPEAGDEVEPIKKKDGTVDEVATAIRKSWKKPITAAAE